MGLENSQLQKFLQQAAMDHTCVLHQQLLRFPQVVVQARRIVLYSICIHQRRDALLFEVQLDKPRVVGGNDLALVAPLEGRRAGSALPPVTRTG